MPDSSLFTYENALNRATLFQAPLAESKLRLLDSYTPGPSTNRAELLAAEAKFDGYPEGGYNLTVWTGPGLSPTGAGVLTSPTVVISTNTTPTNITTNLTGWWIECNNALTANEPLTVTTGIWNPARAATKPTDQFPFLIQDFEGVVQAPT